MSQKRMILALGLLMGLAFTTVSAQTTERGAATGTAETASKNVVQVAASNPDFSTLVSAVKAADLATTLSGAGPFTVFAPTNEAFAALPAGTLDELLKPENKAKLASILTFHVVPGKLKAADLKDGQKLTTVAGEELTVSTTGGKVTVNGTEVKQADVAASNGIIHVLGGVLVPTK